MFALKIIALVLGGIATWTLVGCFVVLCGALISHLCGGDWFQSRNYKGDRWARSPGFTLPPFLTVILWPLVLPVAVICGIGVGFFVATEKITDSIIAHVENYQKKLNTGTSS